MASLPQDLISTDKMAQSPTPSRPRKPRRSTNPKLHQTSSPAPETTKTPFTPPHNKLHDNLIRHDQNGVLAATDRNARGRKKVDKPTPDNLKASSPTPKKPRSPQMTQQATITTPVKNVKPTTQAYAGPTFHASPAASSLPIPKFFSKQMTSADAPSSSSSKSREDSSENSSAKSEDSPTTMDALLVANDPTKDPSPLDIFFKADREEKARRISSSLNSLQVSRDNADANLEQPINNSESVSPTLLFKRRHAEYRTENSVSGILPSEMDASEKNQNSSSPTRASICLTDGQRSESSPTIMLTRATDSEEAAKAKTKALKQLLLSPLPQSPASAVPLSEGILSNENLPFSSPSPHSKQSGRSDSGSSTPKQGINHVNHKAHRQTDYGVPSYFKRHQSDVARGSPQPRPLSSGLRREVLPNSTIEGNEPSFAPSPSRVSGLHRPAFSSTSHNQRSNRETLPFTPNFPRFRSQDALKAAGQSDVSIRSMEDELRKILKIDLLNSGGATGVHT